jgi:hypothetical protein
VKKKLKGVKPSAPLPLLEKNGLSYCLNNKIVPKVLKSLNALCPTTDNDFHFVLKYFNKEQPSNRFIILCQHFTTVMSVCMCYHTPSMVIMDYLYVHISAQGRGIGSTLLTLCTDIGNVLYKKPSFYVIQYREQGLLAMAGILKKYCICPCGFDEMQCFRQHTEQLEINLNGTVSLFCCKFYPRGNILQPNYDLKWVYQQLSNFLSNITFSHKAICNDVKDAYNLFFFGSKDKIYDDQGCELWYRKDECDETGKQFLLSICNDVDDEVLQYCIPT